VGPRLKLVFGALLRVTLGAWPSLSTAVGSTQEARAEEAPGAAVTVMSLGQLLITGGVLSVGVPLPETVMVKAQEAKLPELSKKM